MGLQRGSLVVERWSFPPWSGGYTCFQPAPGTPLGAPTAKTLPHVYVEGVTYVPQGQRAPKPPARKAVVYYSDELVPLGPDQVMADPEGRFLLIKTRENQLYQVPLDETDSATHLLTLDPEWDHEGPSVLSMISLGADEREVYMCHVPFSGYPCLVLRDPDNDGLYAAPSTQDCAYVDDLRAQGWWSYFWEQ